MNSQFQVKNKTITIYSPQNSASELPLVLLNTCNNEGQDVFKQCIETGSNDFILASVSDIAWYDDMTPWSVPGLSKNDIEYSGQANRYLEIIENHIIPQIREYVESDLQIRIRYYALAGYSLAGLFALYAAYRTDLFTRIVSASGSFWFPGFLEFVKENEICPQIEKIYFSLGNKECKSRNQIFAAVEKNTRELERIYRNRNIKTIYEENNGNHFQDAVLRMAKGIRWIL